MSDFKTWKNDDKLTGVDYTYERNLMTDRLEGINETATYKANDLFILSGQQPQLSYLNTVWMDSENALNKLSPQGGLYVASQVLARAIDSYSRLLEDAEISSSVKCIAFFTIPRVASEVFITSSSNVTALPQQNFNRDGSETITSEENITATAQQNLSIFITGVETNSTHNVSATGQQNLSINIENVLISSSHNITVETQQNQSGEVTDAGVVSSMNITATPQQNFNKSGAESTSSDYNFTAEVQQNFSVETPPVSITSENNITAVIQQNLSVNLTGAETNSSSLYRANANTEGNISTFVVTSSDILFNAATQQDFVKSSTGNIVTSDYNFTASINQNLSTTGSQPILSEYNFKATTNQNFIGTILVSTQNDQLFEASFTNSGFGSAVTTVTSDELFRGTQTNAGSDSAVTTVTSDELFRASQFIIANQISASTSISSNVVIDGGPATYLLQIRGFGASSVIDVTYSDTGLTQYYAPSGVLITLRSETPLDTQITLTAPSSVNYNGNTWYFDKWRYNSIGFETTSRTTSETVTNDEIYEVYYELPSAAAWSIYSFGQPYNETFTVFSDNDTGDSTILALVTSNYPPQNYPIGVWKRVRVFNYDMELIATRYVERTS